MTGDAAPLERADARGQLGVRGAGDDGGDAATLDRLVTLSFVLSLVGILIWGCALVGLILGLVARRWTKAQGRPRRKLVTASIVIGAVPVGLGALALLALVVWVALTG